MKRALLIFALAPFVMAQAKPPVLSDAQKAAFWKAQAVKTQAEAEAQAVEQKVAQARTNFSAAVKQLTDACGADFQPQMSKDGDPVCVAKPAEKPDAKTEPKK